MIKEPNEIPDENPFKVPENYFEEVNRKILSVTSGHTHVVKKTGIFDRYKSVLAIAAGFAGLIILSYVTVKVITPDKVSTQVSEVLVNSDSENYLNEIDLPTLEESASTLGLSDEDLGVSKNDIIDYLLLENIEISEIYEKL